MGHIIQLMANYSFKQCWVDNRNFGFLITDNDIEVGKLFEKPIII